MSASRSSRVKEFFASVAPFREGDGPEHKFHWGISTADPGVIGDNARENSLVVDQLFWERIGADVHKLEKNCVTLIQGLLCSLSPEGHDSNGDLVGTGWLKEGGTAWDTWSEWDTEPMRDYGALATLWKGSSEQLWAGLSPTGRDLLSCTFTFFDSFPGPTKPVRESKAKDVINSLTRWASSTLSRTTNGKG